MLSNPSMIMEPMMAGIKPNYHNNHPRTVAHKANIQRGKSFFQPNSSSCFLNISHHFLLDMQLYHMVSMMRIALPCRVEMDFYTRGNNPTNPSGARFSGKNTTGETIMLVCLLYKDQTLGTNSSFNFDSIHDFDAEATSLPPPSNPPSDSTRVEFPPSFSVPPDHVTRRHVSHRAETICNNFRIIENNSEYVDGQEIHVLISMVSFYNIIFGVFIRLSHINYKNYTIDKRMYDR